MTRSAKTRFQGLHDRTQYVSLRCGGAAFWAPPHIIATARPEERAGTKGDHLKDDRNSMP